VPGGGAALDLRLVLVSPRVNPLKNEPVLAPMSDPHGAGA